MSVASILLFGLLLGVQHATEADHLAAVATLATRQSTLAQTVRQGVAWGVGHTLALMGFAGTVLLLGQAIPPGLEHGLEAAVGAMLVLLGLDVLRRLARERIHFHAHRHAGAGEAHVHAHTHRGEAAPHARSPHAHAHGGAGDWPLRALAVGTMHGLAGSAALVVLSLKSVPTLALGIGYIALFGLGSIAGMALLSAVVALPLRLGATHLGRVHTGMTALVGLLSCGLGVAVLAGQMAA